MSSNTAEFTTSQTIITGWFLISVWIDMTDVALNLHGHFYTIYGTERNMARWLVVEQNLYITPKTLLYIVLFNEDIDTNSISKERAHLLLRIVSNSVSG